jgi:3-hydroxyacyl-CoA dehydrogenase
MSPGYALHGPVAVITIDNPPVNGMNHALRTSIVEGIDRAQADSSVSAIVLTGAGGLFSGGADIREFTTPQARAEPTLPTVIAIVESSEKPVIAAIGGSCMGGGLELALGCHFRVAVPHAQIALPEVKLGLLPGAGGTQRLPRAIGVEAALNMIVSGASVPCERFRGTALFDAIADGDVLQGALAFASGERAGQRPLPRVRDIVIDYPNADALFQFARNTVGAMARGFPAPFKCIEAVAAPETMPYEEA